MTVGKEGLNLIKQFEGCVLHAYKPVPTEKYWTIGYGHYGADVKAGMVISKAQAEAYLIADCQRFANAVDKLGLKLNTNQRDALISFAYNCGEGNLKKLVAGRTLSQIADAFMLYTRAGGKVLKGLERRRKAERELFLRGMISTTTYPTIRYGDKNDYVGKLQERLNYMGYGCGKVDNIFGKKTLEAVKCLQVDYGLTVDGIVGKNTWNAILK